jgi:hypothetical protein
MGHLGRTFVFPAVIGVLLLWVGGLRAAEFDSSANEVVVHFVRGDTTIQPFQKDAQAFINHADHFQEFPAEMNGLSFTQRNMNQPSDLTIDVPAGTTLYALFGPKGPANRARSYAEANGWTHLGDVHLLGTNNDNWPMPLYKKTFDQAEHAKLVGSGNCGVLIVGPNLRTSDSSTPTLPKQAPKSAAQPKAIEISGSGPTTRVSKLQSSIQGLYVVIEDTGEHLGLASQLILTVTPGDVNDGATVPINFTTPAGHEMYMVLDDVVRALGVHYRISGVKKFELSFEDKYTPKDGGSIGAAIGTLLLSAIRNFDIDPNFAITGDVTADSKVRRIGGVAAKLRGAARSGCKVVAVPTENLEQVQDALVYDGPSDLLNIQVIGVSSLDDCAAAARIDRSSNLSEAIDLFSRFQESTKQSPNYIFSSEAQERLHQVLDLFPNHYSAMLLLRYSRHQLPRLSALATEYYTSIAVKEFGNTPVASAKVSDFAAQDALTKLNKLRPIGDLTVRPFLDSWIGLIDLYIRARSGGGVSSQDLNDQYQKMLNEASKLDANRELSEKLLHEGV